MWYFLFGKDTLNAGTRCTRANAPQMLLPILRNGRLLTIVISTMIITTDIHGAYRVVISLPRGCAFEKVAHKVLLGGTMTAQ